MVGSLKSQRLQNDPKLKMPGTTAYYIKAGDLSTRLSATISQAIANFAPITYTSI